MINKLYILYIMNTKMFRELIYLLPALFKKAIFLSFLVLLAYAKNFTSAQN